jgi:hypothetical protein
LKEENKSQVAEWRQEIKADMEKITPNRGVEIGPIQEEMKEGLMRIRVESQSAFDQLKQTIDSSLQRLKETGEVQAFRSKKKHNISYGSIEGRDGEDTQ